MIRVDEQPDYLVAFHIDFSNSRLNVVEDILNSEPIAPKNAPAVALISLAVAVEEFVTGCLLYDAANCAAEEEVDFVIESARRRALTLRQKLIEFPKIVSSNRWVLDMRSPVARHLLQLVSVRNQLVHPRPNVWFASTSDLDSDPEAQDGALRVEVHLQGASEGDEQRKVLGYARDPWKEIDRRTVENTVSAFRAMKSQIYDVDTSACGGWEFIAGPVFRKK